MSLYYDGNDDGLTLQYLPLSYDPTSSDASAKALIFALYPEWETSPGKIEFIRFKEGITNNVCEECSVCGFDKSKPAFSYSKRSSIAQVPANAT
jgi:hypothetical protein